MSVEIGKELVISMKTTSMDKGHSVFLSMDGPLLSLSLSTKPIDKFMYILNYNYELNQLSQRILHKPFQQCLDETSLSTS